MLSKLLVVLASLLVPLALGALWLRGEVLSTHRYVQTVTPLAGNRAIDAAVTSRVTATLSDQVAVPVTVQALAGTAVEQFLRTPAFKRLWVSANRRAHRAFVAAIDGRRSAFVGPDGSVGIDLSAIVVAARQALDAAGVHLFDAAPLAAQQSRIVIARAPALHRLRRAVRILKALAIALPVVAAVLYALGFALARNRRRALLVAAGALAAAGALGVGVVVASRWLYLDELAGRDVPRDAASALYNTVLADLRLWLELTCGAGLVVSALTALVGRSRASGRTAVP